MHFRAKHRFLDCVNKHSKFCKLPEFLVHMHRLVHSFSVDIRTHAINIKLFMCSHFRKFLRRMFETARECTLTKEDLVCSMIMISENAAPMTLMVMDPQCNCEKQEYPVLHSITIVICDTSMISANVVVLLKETFSSLYLSFLLTVW